MLLIPEGQAYYFKRLYLSPYLGCYWLLHWDVQAGKKRILAWSSTAAYHELTKVWLTCDDKTPRGLFSKWSFGFRKFGALDLLPQESCDTHRYRFPLKFPKVSGLSSEATMRCPKRLVRWSSLGEPSRLRTSKGSSSMELGDGNLQLHRLVFALCRNLCV